MHNAKHLLLPLLLAGAFVIVACGGGGDSVVGDVSCAPLSALRAYRYEAIGITELRASEDPPSVITSGVPQPFRFVIEVDGEVQAADKISVVTRQGDGVDFQEGRTVVIADTAWVFLGLWVEKARSPYAVPYVPLDTCNAIAPDLSLAELPFTSEDVNGIPSRRYQLEIPNEFFGRHPNFQQSSDAAQLIDTVTVDVSVAEDARYPTRLSVKGSGDYSNGNQILAEVGYEISDVNAPDIEIEPPCSDDCR